MGCKRFLLILMLCMANPMLLSGICSHLPTKGLVMSADVKAPPMPVSEAWIADGYYSAHRPLVANPNTVGEPFSKRDHTAQVPH